MKKLLVLFCLFVTAILLGQVTISVSPDRILYNSLSPANFNPDHPELQPILFTIDIHSKVGIDYRLKCTLSNANYPDAVIEIIPSDETPNPITITNRDIVTQEDSQYFSVIEAEYTDFIDAMGEDIMNSGRVPDGDYIFFIEAFKTDDSEACSSTTVTMTIESPITISLITPGTPLGNTPASISTQHPNFVWFSNLDEYTFKLYELNYIMNNSEDIEQQYYPIFETQISESSFTYPPSAPGFYPGNIYVWQITAETNTSSGTCLKKSMMYNFIFSQQYQTPMENQQVINFFNQLNNEQFEQITTLLESGYSVNGLLWKGEEKSMENLNEIIQQISKNKLKIKEITVE